LVGSDVAQPLAIHTLTKAFKEDGMKVRTTVRGGRLGANHNDSFRVRAMVSANKPEATKADGLKVRTGLEAGRLGANHSEQLRVRSAVRAGRIAINHNEMVRS
jgi:hypothetical protein